MFRKIPASTLGNSDLGWLKSRFHFSFADYRNSQRINFGVLRVINDDLVKAGTGFDTHPHRDMEIISYVVDGELTHGDSMGNQHTISRGQMQYMSAGTGILHSEHNRGASTARFLQIWIFPSQNGLKPKYGDYGFEWKLRHNQWLHMVSGPTGDAAIIINQDVNLYVIELEANREIGFSVPAGRQAYLVQIEGDSTINDQSLTGQDGLEIIEEELTVRATSRSHLMIIEMAKA